MKKITAALSVALGVALTLSTQGVNANPSTVVVKRIVDGDTLILQAGGQSFTAQLACIDAPDWIEGNAEPHAEAAKNRITQLLPVGTSVQSYSAGNAGGRVLTVVFQGDRNINLQLVTEGYAKLHPSYRQTCSNFAQALAEAENQARTQSRVVWSR